jgi:STE24 endopeptidase
MAASSLVLLAFVTVLTARLGLEWLNFRHQQRQAHRVPPELEGAIDAERLAKTTAYTRDRIRLNALRTLLGGVVLAAFLFGGILGAYDRFIQASIASYVGSGVVFFVGLAFAESLLSVPFSLYSDFRIEARYGFNRKTARLWWSDWLKSTLLSLVFIALLSAAALALVRAAPGTWWLWVGAVICAFTLILLFISPYVIEPLFNKMEPLQTEGLVDAVRALATRAGVRVERIQRMDASRRSAHSNAYFTGIGRVKRVVLFDTLLDQMSQNEILAVLAHELGHWKKHHIVSRLVVTQLLTFGILYVAFRLLGAAEVPTLIGLSEASIPARFLILLTLGSLASFPLTPLFSYWSRRHEWQADQFAVELWGKAGDLADALLKMGRENLSNLHPHPLYAAFYYSHPPLALRIRKLRLRA